MEDSTPFPLHTKRKILILSSKGGYGHISASRSIQEIFQDQYIFQEVFPIEKTHQVGSRSGENLYNMLIKNDWIRMTNFMSNSLAPLWFQARREGIESLIQEYIQKEEPDLILSVIPYINYPASEAARKSNIPYLLVTTDNDLTHWVLGLEHLRHPNFKVTVGRNHDLTDGLLTRCKVPSECIERTGLPIHPEFSKEKDEKSIKQEFGVPLNKPVITIMMGGAGGKGALEYANLLKEMDFPLHVVICTGNNRPLYDKMKDLVFENQAVTFSVLSFTNKIADLMQISDLIITKPGPGTINEAMAKKLPILLDNTNSTLSWERTNRELVLNAGIGQVLDRAEDVKKWVFKYLYDEEIQRHTELSYRHTQSISFSENIYKTVSSLMDANCAQVSQMIAKA